MLQSVCYNLNVATVNVTRKLQYKNYDSYNSLTMYMLQLSPVTRVLQCRCYNARMLQECYNVNVKFPEMSSVLGIHLFGGMFCTHQRRVVF